MMSAPSCWARVVRAAGPIEGALELDWLESALDGVSTAALWQGPRELVAPLSYRRYAGLDAACAASAAQGWPVRLRRSGGGLVPQGPGILNLSLAYPCAGPAGSMMEAVYARLCAILARALARLGILAATRAVQGSFCDGRFNLAIDSGGGAYARKIAGTAQYWRRRGERHAVLAHALLIVDADPGLLAAQANRFEQALGSGRHYDPQALTSVQQAWSDAHPGRMLPPDLPTQTAQCIAGELESDHVQPIGGDHDPA
jgi:lipoate-protein ligase A